MSLPVNMQQSIPVSIRVKNIVNLRQKLADLVDSVFVIKAESPTQQEDTAGKGLINIWIVLPKG